MNALRTLRLIVSGHRPLISMLLILIGIALTGPAAVLAR